MEQNKGFQRGALLLKFADEQFEGLEIRMKRLPVGDLVMISALAELGKDIADMQDQLGTLMNSVVSNMISWNMLDEDFIAVPIALGSPAKEEDGEYIPSTGMYAQDLELILSIVETWISQAAGMSKDMGKASKNGRMPDTTPQEEFALMQAVQLSQVSSPEQN